MIRLLAHITELPCDILSQEWFSPGVPAVMKFLALFLDDSLFCFVGFTLRWTPCGLLSSYPHITVLKRETGELFWQVWRAGPFVCLRILSSDLIGVHRVRRTSLSQSQWLTDICIYSY